MAPASGPTGATALIILDMINLFDFEGGDRLGAQAVAICP
ncbi:MAG TPA: cysteine hydrolase, partial [Stenotrophomonas sp.]|nr:cysteine hydrolase [Stenotrophomonas sp.]